MHCSRAARFSEQFIGKPELVPWIIGLLIAYRLLANRFWRGDACPCDRRGCNFKEGLDQSKPKRSTEPDEVYVPRKRGPGERNFTERETFRPGRRPIMDK